MFKVLHHKANICWRERLPNVGEGVSLTLGSHPTLGWRGRFPNVGEAMRLKSVNVRTGTDRLRLVTHPDLGRTARGYCHGERNLIALTFPLA